jgi:hypothetical protein
MLRILEKCHSFVAKAKQELSQGNGPRGVYRTRQIRRGLRDDTQKGCLVLRIRIVDLRIFKKMMMMPG